MSPLTVLLLVLIPVVHGLRAELDKPWNLFKQNYGKYYKSKEMEFKRRSIWEKNVDFVQKHNLEYDLGFHTYTAGINEFSDWSPKEYAATLNGYVKEKERRDIIEWDYNQTAKSLPSNVDWRTKGYVTPVKNQGACGSCWAFSSTGALEGQQFRKTGKLVSLSEQNLVDCVKKGSAGCGGGSMTASFQYVKTNGGIDTEDCYPYKAKNGNCTYQSSCRGSTCSGTMGVKQGNELQLQALVALQGPVSVAIDASHPSFQHYRSGVYSDPACRSNWVDHAVLVVGYGTLGGEDYWLIKNSWGSSWGNKGYIMLARNKNNMCSVATFASIPLV